jgi:uncharacterized protein DUF3592
MSDNLLLALVAGGFGAIVLVLVVLSLREAAAMKRWPVAKGRVLSSKVEEYRTGAASANFGGPRNRMTLYRPVVIYEYEVDGHRFTGDRIAQSPGMHRGVSDFAQQTADRYRAGTEVDVRYNPERPSECVLEPRVPKSWILGLMVGMGLLALAAYLYSE